MRRVALCSVIVACLASNVLAQDRTDNAGSEPPETELKFDELQQGFDTGKHADGDYTSQAVGKKKRWQLDSGEFDLDSTAPRPRRNSGDTDGYTGFRLRLPSRPK